MNVLIIVPHPDDEILGFGGAIQRHTSLGDSVHVCYLCPGDSIRLKAQFSQINQVAADFGFTPHILPDEVCASSFKSLLSYVGSIIKNTKPDVLYTVFNGDNHQDHEWVFKVVRVAARPLCDFLIKKIYLGEILSSTDQAPRLASHAFVPNRYLILSAAEVDKKIHGLKMYPGELRQWPHPRSEKGILGLAEKRGSECHQPFAEAYMILRDIQF